MSQLSTKKLLFTAYLWNMLGKLIVRSLGIVSTLILVRLLDPKDFGIVAIGMMIIGFFEVLSNAGINRYLILQESPTDDDYNSAWTLNILLRIFLLLVLVLLAPYVSQWFDSPALESVIYIMCLTQFIGAFKNIGMVKLEKQLNYRKENQVLVSAKVFSFIAGLSAAYYFKNYYALLIGTVVNITIGVIGSYLVVHYRPKLNFNFSTDMFAYSKFLLLRNIVSYSRSQMDIFLVGNRFGDSATGQFTIARQFSILPQTELITPAMQPMFAGLAKFKSEPEKLMVNSMLVLQLCYLFLIPCAFGVLAIAEPFTYVVLGEKWLPVKDFLGILAFLMIIFITQPILNTLYDANNKVKYSMYPDVVGIAALLLGFLTVPIGTVSEFAYLRISVGAFSFCCLILFAKYFINLSILKVLELLSLPTICSITMYFTLLLFSESLNIQSQLVELLVMGLIGTVSYTFMLLMGVVLIAKLIRKGEVYRLLSLIPEKYRYKHNSLF